MKCITSLFACVFLMISECCFASVNTSYAYRLGRFLRAIADKFGIRDEGARSILWLSFFATFAFCVFVWLKSIDWFKLGGRQRIYAILIAIFAAIPITYLLLASLVMFFY